MRRVIFCYTINEIIPQISSQQVKQSLDMWIEMEKNINTLHQEFDFDSVHRFDANDVFKLAKDYSTHLSLTCLCSLARSRLRVYIYLWQGAVVAGAKPSCVRRGFV